MSPANPTGDPGRPPVELPPPPVAQGLYEPAVAHAGLVFTAGMTPRRDGRLVAVGRLGAEVDMQTGRDAAALAALRADRKSVV